MRNVGNNHFDHRKVDQKWQKKWRETKRYHVKTTQSRDKAYVLDMFPYPSGEGLHVGHPLGYIGSDILARRLRAQGKDVLHPMGWDAFGLPAENYAIKTGTHPAATTATAIKRFREQLKLIGLSYDWDREVNTSDPSYYRWTQWLFLKLYERGLAYRAKAPVNWCPSCQTVLANEQVKDGRCDRCDSEVLQKELEQWFFKITAYADELLSEVDKLDWPEPTKIMQRNWIGKKEGVLIDHRVEGSDLTLTSFSAFPAWLFADTFLVIAPEHPLVPQLIQGTAEEQAVERFIQESREISHEDRLADRFEKRGVFTGRYVTDPFSGKKMPVWLANFALVDFGTGIIRCSAHDPRDYAFAQKYQISLREVVARTNPDEPVNAHENVGTLENSGPFTGKLINRKLIQEIVDWIVKEKIGHRKITYRLRDWLVSRQRYWGAPIPIIYCRKCLENSKFQIPNSKIDWTEIDGKKFAIIPVPVDQLPVELPTDVDFKPTGQSPLINSKSFHMGARCPNCGGQARREVDTMDTFVDSSWYFLRFTDPHNSQTAFNPKLVEGWLPVDWYVGGSEHAVLHLLYSRFFTKVLADLHFLNFREPFMRLRHQGLIMGEDNRKMSKRWGNVINPDDVVRDYGADALRCFEMFMGPFDESKPWSTSGLIGIRRWLERVFRLQAKYSDQRSAISNEGKRILHQTIKKVTEDIEAFHFNTAVSQLMILTNALEKEPHIEPSTWKIFLTLLTPFAPHLTHELWEQANFADHPDDHPWPKAESDLLKAKTITLPIQINGRVRGEIDVLADAAESDILTKARSLPVIAAYLDGKTILREVLIPGRIINFVIE